MRLFTLFVSLLFTGVSFAQSPTPNFTATDCWGNTKDLYSTLASGKAILIASKGVDCSICANQSPSYQTWAAQNSTTVDVWAAMTYTYRSTSPSCSQVVTWSNNYGWNNVFSFVDANEYWYQGGTPRYTVISPVDSTVAYSGHNRNTARATALSLSTVGITDFFVANNIQIIQQADRLQLNRIPETVRRMELLDLSGRLIQTINVLNGSASTSTEGLNTGVYLVRLQGEAVSAAQKVLIH